MGTLTVRENFQFSASLRLPSNLSTRERNERVDTVIQELGLGHCADTKVRWLGWILLVGCADTMYSKHTVRLCILTTIKDKKGALS